MSYGGMEKPREQREIQTYKTGNEYQQFQATLKKIEHILSHTDDFKRFYGSKAAEIISDAYNIAKTHLNQISQNQPIQASEQQRESILNASKIMIDVLLTNQISDFIRDLSIELSRLWFNWNKHICRCNDITRNTRTMESLAVGQLTMFESIDIMKNLLQKLKGEMHFKPYAFDLSRAYLQLDET